MTDRLQSPDLAAVISAAGPPQPWSHGPDPELTAFCDEQRARVVAMIAAIVVDRQVAEDLAQEAFLRVHLHWERVRRVDSPGAWLSRVAINLANSWWRRRYREARANRRHDAGRHRSHIEETAEVLAVRAAVAALPRRQRTAVTLRYLGGLSVAETAQVMRCRQGTVKSLSSKAMTALRARFEEGPSGETGAGQPGSAPATDRTEEMTHARRP